MACNLGRRAMNDDDEHYVHATETFQGTLARSGSRQKKILWSDQIAFQFRLNLRCAYTRPAGQPTVYARRIAISVRCRPLWDFEGSGFGFEDLMVRIGEFDQHAVRPRWQTLDDDRFFAGVKPMPWAVIDRDVKMAEPWDHLARSLAVDRHDLQVLGSECDDHQPVG